jgi:hypothetical protein
VADLAERCLGERSLDPEKLGQNEMRRRSMAAGEGDKTTGAQPGAELAASPISAGLRAFRARMGAQAQTFWPLACSWESRTNK